jgi:hypothetical protein
MMGRRAASAALTSALALTALALLLIAPLAQAAPDPLGSGTTTLSFAKPFLALLRQHGVRILPIAPATAQGTSIALPVSGGEMDPIAHKGTIDHEGALLFKSAHNSLPLRIVVLKTQSGPLIARVGGGQLKVATSNKLGFKRDGFGTDFSAMNLKLTANVAVRLDKKLHIGKTLKEGQTIGQLISRTQPKTVRILPLGKMSFQPDPATFAKLAARFVSVNPIFPAEHSGSAFTFPIIALGAISPSASLGTLRTGGSLELLQLGGGQIFGHEFWLNFTERSTSAELDVEPSPPYSGKRPQTPILELSLGTATVSANPGARTISVQGAAASLNPALARSFDEAFAHSEEAFRAGEGFGTFSFVAQGQ